MVIEIVSAALVLAAIICMAIVATRQAPSAEALSALMAQSEESKRHSEAMNNKLIQQLMAVTKPAEYMNFRKGDSIGVPSGSTQPVQDHATPEKQPRASKNGQQLTREQVASAAAAALRDTMGEMAPVSISNPSDVDRGSGLP